MRKLKAKIKKLIIYSIVPMSIFFGQLKNPLCFDEKNKVWSYRKLKI